MKKHERRIKYDESICVSMSLYYVFSYVPTYVFDLHISFCIKKILLLNAGRLSRLDVKI